MPEDYVSSWAACMLPACPQDMNLPGLHLHELVGDRQGTWAVKVSGNWRLTFSFTGQDAYDVNYEDYH